MSHALTGYIMFMRLRQRWSIGTRWMCLAVVVMSVTAVMGGLAGCQPKTRKAAPSAAPPPTYTGPGFLRGTVGSLAGLQTATARPLLVSGYGIVVFPAGTGTGSSEVPAFLRQRLINQARKFGLGSAALKARASKALKPFLSLTPARFLDSDDTAVVAVQGFIPPGATPGTRMDVLVSAVDSQTTNLSGGTLWTTDLAIKGTDPALRFSKPLATAYGSIYVNPLKQHKDAREDFHRQAVVIAGGKVTHARKLVLGLHQPSWTRSRLISDRINEHFGRTTDRASVANPKTATLIDLRIPPRWSNRPGVLLGLISHLFVERGPDFEPRKAAQLVNVLAKQPKMSSTIVMTWRSLGRNAIPVLRKYYDDPRMYMKLAALEAGAWLKDEHASRYLNEAASNPDPAIRRRAAAALVHLPQSLQGASTLRRLLNDDDRSVRIAAYESLAAINDRTILDRYAVTEAGGEGKDVKFIIDRVPSDKPLIYVTQTNIPRLVVFDKNLDLHSPELARLWDNRLMMRVTSSKKPMSVFYQPINRVKPITHKIFPHSVAALAYALGHEPNARDAQEGFGLSYSQVVDVIYQLSKKGLIQAPIEVHQSPLAKLVDKAKKIPTQRPETSVSSTGAGGGQKRDAATFKTTGAPSASGEATP